MYAVLKLDNTIGSFDNRNKPLSDIVHPDLQHLYISVPVDATLKLGDIYHRDTQTWESIELEPEPEFISPPYQPTNAEVAQMISDLQADLIIAGVI